MIVIVLLVLLPPPDIVTESYSVGVPPFTVYLPSVPTEMVQLPEVRSQVPVAAKAGVERPARQSAAPANASPKVFRLNRWGGIQ